MGAHLGAEAVLERGDDPAAVGVVLGVGAGDQQQVQRQPQRVAADLDVALLEHVEQRHLDALGEVGQLVDAEDAAVGARDQAVVHGLGVAERAALGDLDRVDVADEVADAGVGGGELLAVPLAAVQPVDRQGVAELGAQPAAARADRRVRVVVDLAAGDDRRPLVEQADRACGSGGSCPGRARRAARSRGRRAGRARPAGSTVSSKPTMPGKRWLAAGEAGEQVGADLGLDRPVRRARGAQLAEGGGKGSGGRGGRRSHEFDATPERRDCAPEMASVCRRTSTVTMRLAAFSGA